MRGLEAVEERHRDVEHGNVGLELANQLYACAPVRSLADHFDALPLEQRLEALSQDHVVIRQHNPRRHR